MKVQVKLLSFETIHCEGVGCLVTSVTAWCDHFVIHKLNS